MITQEEIQAMASEVAKREGGKSEASIGDIREIIGLIADLVYEKEQAGFLAYGKYFSHYGEQRYYAKQGLPMPEKPKLEVNGVIIKAEKN